MIVADPSADRVGRWVVDAASLVPALNALKGVHQAEYEQGLQKIAGAVISASSRIFPLSGGIIENQDGNGYVNYSFLNGVTTTCRSGCFCRVNSLYRLDWCEYAAASGKQAYSTCVNTVGTANYTTGWGAECLQNHARAWNSDVNEHFRARAYLANKRVVASRCPPGACTPAQVVSAVQVGFQ